MNDEKITSKRCTKCGVILPIENFSPRRWRSIKEDGHYVYGYYGHCKSCIAKRKAEWRLRNKQYMLNYYKANPEKHHKQLNTKDNV